MREEHCTGVRVHSVRAAHRWRSGRMEAPLQKMDISGCPAAAVKTLLRVLRIATAVFSGRSREGKYKLWMPPRSVRDAVVRR